MGYAMVAGGKPDMAAPVSGILLSSIAEGSIVKLNESGSPVEFYVAKHNYENVLNGDGRTLLVRKDCYDSRVWNGSGVNTYATSDINAWLNSDYKSLFDDNTKTAIGTTKFYYTKGNVNTTLTTLERSIFMLSVTELGKTDTHANIEGSALPIASTLKIAYLNGSAVSQWTRSPYNTDNNWYAFYLNASGGAANYGCSNPLASRPCFTLPSNAMFGKTTMLFKGVA